MTYLSIAALRTTSGAAATAPSLCVRSPALWVLMLYGCLLLTVVLQGCASTSARPAPSAPAATPSPPPAPAAPAAKTAPPVVAPKAPPMPLGTPPALRAPSPLEAERDFLHAWFKDTPVRISTLANGALEVEVPLEFCFEPGRSRLQPALVAVLDKVAQSLRREDDARLVLLAAATDDGGAPGLALLRATQVRSHLVSRGVSGNQLASPSAQAARSVLLRMVLASP